ncbi:MAG: hypothetical protein MH204_05545, partial [Fimbriimonadaceae bacterium]|nr:hypothetical protein [Fimbriimonadaceae bacterium]
YDSNSVQFISDRQFAFAAGVSGIILREQAAATFLLGEFFAESLIFAETANTVGAIQVAGSTQLTQTPFFVAACDYVLIGDEFYAASAYLKREPVLVGSLVGQDWSKIFIAAVVLLGVLLNSYELLTPATCTRVRVSPDSARPEKLVKVTDERLKLPNETIMSHVFRPLITAEMLAVEREMDPEFLAEQAALEAAKEETE